MRLVTTAELKNRTNEVLRTALAGDPVVVTRHGRPVASLLRLEEGDLATLGAGPPRRTASRAAVAHPDRVRTGMRLSQRRLGRAAIGPYQYAGFPQRFGTFYVAFGPAGPVFARVAPSAAAFERDASRYLGAPVQEIPAPGWLAAAVRAAIQRHEAFRGPVDLARVGPFETDVLERLRRIPAGEIRTYREIARSIGQPGAARAVGAACARNPLPLLIPCHRVVRADGGLGGYSLRGGVALKRRLLEAEGALPTLLS